MIRIPTFPNLSSDYDLDIELGGQILNLRLTWNVRTEYWALAVTTPDGTTYGQFKVVPNWLLISRIRSAARIPGNLVVLRDDATAPTDITYDSLGTSWGLYYLDPDEVEQWEIDNGVR